KSGRHWYDDRRREGFTSILGGAPCFAQCPSNPPHLKRPLSPVPPFSRDTAICGLPMNWRRCSLTRPFWPCPPHTDHTLSPLAAGACQAPVVRRRALGLPSAV